jgi:hypothetical protein
VDSSCIAKVRIRFAKPSHRIAGEEVSEDFSGVSITGVDQMERNIDGSHMGIRLHGCQWSDMSPLVAVSSTGDLDLPFMKGKVQKKPLGVSRHAERNGTGFGNREERLISPIVPLLPHLNWNGGWFSPNILRDQQYRSLSPG